MNSNNNEILSYSPLIHKNNINVTELLISETIKYYENNNNNGFGVSKMIARGGRRAGVSWKHEAVIMISECKNKKIVFCLIYGQQ